MKNNPLKNIYQNVSLIFSTNILTTIITFIQTVILARLLGVEYFGLLAIITSYAIILEQIIDVRIGEWITKYLSMFWVEKNEYKTLALIKSGLIISTLVGVISLIFGFFITRPVVIYLFHQESFLPLFYIHIIVLPFVVYYSYSDSILRFFGKYWGLSMIKVLSALFKLILLLLILAFAKSITNVIYIITCSIIIENLVLLFFTLFIIKRQIRVGWTNAPIKLLTKDFYSMKQLLFHTKFRSFIRIFFLRGDILLLGMLSVPEQVGLYKLAKNIIGLLMQISTPIYHVIFPEINRLWHMKDQDKFVRFVRSVTKLTVIVVGSAAFILYFGSPFIINIFFNKSFIGANKLVQVMIFGLAIQQIFSWVFPSILSMNKIKTHNIFSLIIAVFVGVPSLYFLPIFGSLGMAYLYLIYPITITIISLIIIYRELQIQSRLSVEVAL